MRVLSALLTTAMVLIPNIAHAQEKPRNVLLIVADDLLREIGCYGNKAIQTPHLDALAKRGVLFTQAYSSVASCSPSRASLYTGLYTHQNGQYGLQHAAHKQEAHPWVQALPQLLRAAGYWTGIIGKIHVGPQSVYQWHAEITGKGLKGNRDVVAMAQASRDFINKREQKPFFLIVGYSDPHRAAKGFGNEPFAKDPKEVRYDPKKVVVPYHLPDRPEVRAELAEYYQSVTRMDRGVGLLMEVLEQTGQLGNTLIIFVSDNGMPFPGAKTTLYGAGVHLPLIVCAPNQKTRGHQNNAMVSYIDIAPTILEWSKAKGPKGYSLPGKSFLPILDEQNPKGWDLVFGSHQFHEITMYYPMRFAQTRKHKYILNYAHALDYPFASDLWASDMWQGILKRGDKMMGQRGVDAYLHRPREELYDIEKDPNELKNLAGDSAYASVLQDMRQRLRAWQTATDDPWTILYREERR